MYTDRQALSFCVVVYVFRKLWTREGQGRLQRRIHKYIHTTHALRRQGFFFFWQRLDVLGARYWRHIGLPQQRSIVWLNLATFVPLTSLAFPSPRPLKSLRSLPHTSPPLLSLLPLVPLHIKGDTTTTRISTSGFSDLSA